MKEEPIDITFSYWDGSGHRRSITLKKGRTIYQFLQKALEVLRMDFTELKTVTADQLMYVKEDLIIPQTNTFYDFIVTKVRLFAMLEVVVSELLGLLGQTEDPLPELVVPLHLGDDALVVALHLLRDLRGVLARPVHHGLGVLGVGQANLKQE